MKNRYVISGYYGFNNFGDELILSILCDKLKNEGADVTVFSVNPVETSQKYGVKASPTFNIPKVINEILKTDVLISGGGSLFQDATSIGSLFYYAFVLFTAQLFKKTTIIYRQGVGPLNNPLSRFLVKNLFKRCSYITVRDEKSLNLLRNWGIKAELGDDPVWEIALPPLRKEDAMGIQLRNCNEITDAFLQKLAYAVAKKDPHKIKLFSLQKNADFEICSKFRNIILKLLPNSEIVIVEDNLIEELSSVQKLIAMRYHALIIGMKAKAECVGINYDIKVQTLAEKYSLPLINFDDLPDDIAGKLF
ncbi:polysaccharide pyruvyl transferase CsaB [bacterium]|nr:polysaccharide pyruvyl transferase CsaB [bacterium]